MAIGGDDCSKVQLLERELQGKYQYLHRDLQTFMQTYHINEKSRQAQTQLLESKLETTLLAVQEQKLGMEQKQMAIETQMKELEMKYKEFIDMNRQEV
jgi:hypothetical protein